MKLKIGDFVSVLDADLSGRVTAIKNKIICIETNAGFEKEVERPPMKSAPALEQGM